MNKYITIDPGKKGAIIFRDSDNKITVFKMPLIKDQLDYYEFNKLIKRIKQEHPDVKLVCEKVGVIFGTSKTTAFSMGHQSGAIEMCAIANDISYTLVPPKTWQKVMFLGIPAIQKAKSSANDTKAMALIAAKRLFITEDILKTNPKNKPHDGIVDALLISEYACRTNL